MNLDLINSIFQLGAIIFTLFNCFSLYKDKQLKGVSIFAILFFSLFSMWNIFYFYSLSQAYSFIVCLITFIIQIIYFGMVVYYRRNNVNS